MQTGPAEPVCLSSEGLVSRVLSWLTLPDTLSGVARQAMTKQEIALFWSWGLHGSAPRLTIYEDLPKSPLGPVSLPEKWQCDPYLTGLLCKACRTGPGIGEGPLLHPPASLMSLLPS